MTLGRRACTVMILKYYLLVDVVCELFTFVVEPNPLLLQSSTYKNLGLWPCDTWVILFFKKWVFFERFLFVYLLGSGLGIYGKNSTRLLCKKELFMYSVHGER